MEQMCEVFFEDPSVAVHHEGGRFTVISCEPQIRRCLERDLWNCHLHTTKDFCAAFQSLQARGLTILRLGFKKCTQ